MDTALGWLGKEQIKNLLLPNIDYMRTGVSVLSTTESLASKTVPGIQQVSIEWMNVEVDECMHGYMHACREAYVVDLDLPIACQQATSQPLASFPHP